MKSDRKGEMEIDPGKIADTRKEKRVQHKTKLKKEGD